MFKSILVAAFLTLAVLAPRAEAQTVAEADAIENTIRSQVDAMQADDWEKAFTFASPTIQGIFRSPFNFSEMVKRGYPMVWKPKCCFRASRFSGLLDMNDMPAPAKVIFEVDPNWKIFPLVPCFSA